MGLLGEVDACRRLSFQGDWVKHVLHSGSSAVGREASTKLSMTTAEQSRFTAACCRSLPLCLVQGQGRGADQWVRRYVFLICFWARFYWPAFLIIVRRSIPASKENHDR